MTQSSVGAAGRTVRGMGQGEALDQDMGSSAHRLGQTRDLSLATPVIPAHSLAGDATSSCSSFQDASREPSSPLTAHTSVSGAAVDRGHVPDTLTDAQTSSPMPPDTSATSQERRRSHSTPGGSPLEWGDWHLAGMSLREEGIVVNLNQGRGDNQTKRVGTGQPLFTSTSQACLESIDSIPPPASLYNHPAGGPEEQTHGIMADGTMTAGAFPAALHSGESGYAREGRLNLDSLPNEMLMHILSCLEVCDLLATSRVCWFLSF